MIAKNRNLPSDWCNRQFNNRPSYDFIGFESASNILLHHLKLANGNFKQKIQIIVDSDLDGICSAAIVYKFLQKFFPQVEIVYSIHTGKQHGLSNDIKIDNDTTLVIIPDAGTNDIEQCCKLRNQFKGIIVLDHHVVEKTNPYASIVSCMDGTYSNQNLCGAAVTWLFLFGFCQNYIDFFEECQSYLLKMLDLVAAATISDVMDVTNEDNMFFLQNGLGDINSIALKTFLDDSNVNLNDVTVEDIKFKVAPLISAMIRMGNMPEKELLFRAFIDDYEEFEYEKRGSFDVENESIYNRVVRFCKNTKSRQDRAKQKLLDECQVHEYEHIILVEYQADKPSTLTGLVANELANKYCKPCIVYRSEPVSPTSVENREVWFSGSARNYDGSPIEDLKALLKNALGEDGDFAGHANAFGSYFVAWNADSIAKTIEDYIYNNTVFTDANQGCAIGEKLYQVDFAIPSEEVDTEFVYKMHFFESYSGYGFAPVTTLVTGIKVSSENFRTMGKNTFNWKIFDDENEISYIKFKIDKENDALIQKFDDIDIGSTWYSDEGYLIDAICTFGLNIYKGEIHPQAIIKDYSITGRFTKETKHDNEDDDFDFDFN